MGKSKSRKSVKIGIVGRRNKTGRPIGSIDKQPRKRKVVIDDSAEVEVLKRKIGKVVQQEKPVSVKSVEITKEATQLCQVIQVFPDAASSTASFTSLFDSQTDRDDSRLEFNFSSSLPVGEGEVGRSASPSSILPGDEELEPWEIVVDKNGLPRQAGAMMPEGEFVKRYKTRAEQNLFIFAKGIIGLFFLVPHFHRAICKWLQKCPPFRKLLLMPREHCKTGITSNSLPLHILIQDKATNIYFPGLDGSECRILLAGETETMAKKNLRVIQSTFDGNKLFRAFWPNRCWENTRQAKSWSSEQMIIPRKNEWPDPTIRAIGVGGAVTGARPNVMIKDDLVSFKAANSDVVMDEAIEWHKASRALLDKYEVESGLSSLEFTAGTKWAVFDLYSKMLEDPSVEVSPDEFRGIVKDGKILWPEKYTMADIEQLQREHGSNFYLLYLNSAADPELTDFDMNLIRPFTYENGVITFVETIDDERLMKKADIRVARLNGEVPPLNIERGVRVDAAVMKRLIDNGGGFRIRGV